MKQELKTEVRELMGEAGRQQGEKTYTRKLWQEVAGKMHRGEDASRRNKGAKGPSSPKGETIKGRNDKRQVK